MTPNKKIPSHSFTHGVYIDVEAELISLLNEEINIGIFRGIREEYLENPIDVQPLDAPVENLFYYDFQFQSLEEPTVYDDGSWSYQNLFEGVMGIKSEIKDHKFV